MTTPTGPIALSHVQTEFGGSNPIAISEYYRGGSLVPSGTAAGASGVQIATSGTIRLGDFRGVSGFVVSLTGGGTLYAGGDSFTYTETLTVNTNGTITFTDGGPAQWGTPTIAGIGSGYWVRFTRTSFSTTGTGGSGSATGSTGWLQLSSARAVSATANKVSGMGTFVTNASYTIEIATDSGGTNIVGTATGYALRATAVFDG